MQPDPSGARTSSVVVVGREVVAGRVVVVAEATGCELVVPGPAVVVVG